MDNIIREDPPATAQARRSKYGDVAEKLKADPDNWYRIAEGQKTPALASNVRSGAVSAFGPKGDFEAKSAQREDQTYTVWARYVGE